MKEHLKDLFSLLGKKNQAVIHVCESCIYLELLNCGGLRHHNHTHKKKIMGDFLTPPHFLVKAIWTNPQTKNTMKLLDSREKVSLGRTL